MPEGLWIAALVVAVVGGIALWLLSTRRVQRNVSLPDEKNPIDIES